jgi:hypothetical protein
VQRYREVIAKRAAVRRRAQLVGAMVIVGIGIGALLFGPVITWTGRSTILTCNRLRSEPATCSITRTIYGSKVEGFGLSALREATVSVTGSGKRRGYQIELRTADGMVELNPTTCSNCSGASNQACEQINGFVRDPKRESVRVSYSQQAHMQFVGVLVGFLGIGCIVVGLLRALSAAVRK